MELFLFIYRKCAASRPGKVNGIYSRIGRHFSFSLLVLRCSWQRLRVDGVVVAGWSSVRRATSLWDMKWHINGRVNPCGCVLLWVLTWWNETEAAGNTDAVCSFSHFFFLSKGAFLRHSGGGFSSLHTSRMRNVEIWFIFPLTGATFWFTGQTRSAAEIVTSTEW